MALITVDVTGSVTAGAQPGDNFAGDVAIPLEIKTATRSANGVNSSVVAEVNSASFVAVGIPANMDVRLFAMRHKAGPKLSVRVSYEVAVDTDIPLNGLLLIEPPIDDRITNVQVLNDATAATEFEWLATGDLT